MPLVLVTAPAAFITAPEARQHLRIDHTDDDAYIAALIAAAVGHIDGRDGWLGRALGLQTWDLRLDGDECWGGAVPCSAWARRGWRYGIRLPLPPLIEVTSVKYLDTAGVEQTFAPSSYRVTGVGTTRGGFVGLADGASWPSVYSGPEAMTVRFQAGYASVPQPIRQAVLLIVGALYAQREEATAVKLERLPLGAEALLGPFRVFA